FAILEAGRKLKALEMDAYELFRSKHRILTKVVAIHAAWTRQRPATAETDKTYHPGPANSDGDDEDVDQAYSDVTSSHHTRPDHGAKRKRQQDFPTPSGLSE
ncbi:hypothetical protein AX17_006928, partial [Amanita inopinata Kibby_2008]